MERRKFVVGLGALASGSAAAMGTGAFTSVTADRDVSVTVEGDGSAYLGLKNSGDSNDAYFNTNNDERGVDFADTDNGGSGVNPNSTTVAEDVFKIVNQGTQEVEVKLSASGESDLIVQDNGGLDETALSNDGEVAVALASDDDDSDGTSDDTYTLGTGDSGVKVDFAVESGTSDISDLTLTIEADATS